MTDLVALESVHGQIRQWHQDEGLSLADVHQPRRSGAGTLGILVDARDGDARSAALTIGSILSGSSQRVSFQVLAPASEDSALLEHWLAEEPGVEFIRSLAEATLEDRYLLVCPSGVIFGTYSAEAAVEAAEESGAQLLRCLVDGASRSLELWRTAALTSAVDMALAELSVRAAGGERWVSGASLGVHYVGHPAPKQFLRKGKAGKFDVHIVVRDLRNPDTRRDYEHRIRRLEAELAWVKRQQWKEAIREVPPRSVALPFRAMQKGPAYMAARTAARLRRLALRGKR